jgi:hypothetical protein
MTDPTRHNLRSDIPDEYKPADWLIKAPNRPPDTQTLITHRDLLYAAAGRVLSAWELLETLLAGEFQRLIGTERMSAMRAWGGVASSKARVDMLLAAANVELTGDELATFKTCMDDVNRLANCRNLIAHGMVYYQDGDEWTSDDVRINTPGPFGLLPAWYNTNKIKSGSFYVFSIQQIEAILAEIQKMQARIGALSNGDYHRFHRVSMK